MKVNFSRQLLQVARQFSGKTALVNVEKDRSFTYMELHLLTNKICNVMKDRFDLKMGDVYGNLLENDNNSLFGFWALKSLPSGMWFNYRDSFEEHIYQIDYLSPKIVFVEKEIIEKPEYYAAFRERGIEAISMEKPVQKLEGVHYFWDLIETASDSEVDVEYDLEEHISLYRFTGGTTGRGKCAMYVLKNFSAGINQLFSQPENLIDGNTKMLHVTPLSHATSLFVLPLYYKGATQYTMNVPDLNKLCEVVEKHKITSTFVVPTILYRLADLGLEKKYDLSSLETVYYAASPMSPAKLEELQSKFGNIFVQGYGATEAWPFVTMLGKSDHEINAEEDKVKLHSAGRPLLGVEVKIVDSEGNEAPIGETAEIFIRSAAVIKGYYKAPEETLSEFTEDGYWKSGDMGYLDKDGFVYIVDRKKDMIITGGFNVYATEVENVINGHPAVQQSVVIGIPHEVWGEAVHAEVILRESAAITEEELIDFAKSKLGKYKVPKSIEFVTELPQTAVGKVLRRRVRDSYWKETARRI
jgi:fatty-acyl-CoA synthase